MKSNIQKCLEDINKISNTILPKVEMAKTYCLEDSNPKSNNGHLRSINELKNELKEYQNISWINLPAAINTKIKQWHGYEDILKKQLQTEEDFFNSNVAIIKISKDISNYQVFLEKIKNKATLNKEELQELQNISDNLAQLKKTNLIDSNSFQKKLSSINNELDNVKTALNTTEKQLIEETAISLGSLVGVGIAARLIKVASLGRTLAFTSRTLFGTALGNISGKTFNDLLIKNETHKDEWQDIDRTSKSLITTLMTISGMGLAKRLDRLFFTSQASNNLIRNLKLRFFTGALSGLSNSCLSVGLDALYQSYKISLFWSENFGHHKEKSFKKVWSDYCKQNGIANQEDVTKWQAYTTFLSINGIDFNSLFLACISTGLIGSLSSGLGRTAGGIRVENKKSIATFGAILADPLIDINSAVAGAYLDSYLYKREITADIFVRSFISSFRSRAFNFVELRRKPADIVEKQKIKPSLEKGSKILLVSDIPIDKANGITTRALNTKKVLESKGYRVEIFNPHDCDENDRTIDINQKPYRGPAETVYGANKLSTTAITQGITAKLSNYAPNAIHILTEGPIGHVVKDLCLKLNIPYSSSFLSHHQLQGDFSKRIDAFEYLRDFHNESTNRTTPSVTFKQMLESSQTSPTEGHSLKRFSVWPGGIDVHQFSPPLIPRTPISFFGLRIRKPVVIYTGRIVPGKGVEEFLNAKVFDANGKEIKVKKWIVGTGPLLEDLKTTHKNSKDIKFFGHMDHSKLPRLYRKADIFINTSYQETFGMSTLEALRSGCAVVLPYGPGSIDIGFDLYRKDGNISECSAMFFWTPTKNSEDRTKKLGNTIGRAIDTLGKYNIEQEALDRAEKFRWEISAMKLLEFLVPIPKEKDFSSISN